MQIAVIGGGPVGSALSLYLAAHGREVLLIDAGASCHKVCGEGLLPAAWEVLSELGLCEHLTRRAAIQGITYGMAGETVTGALQKPAFGVQRPHLIQVFEQALDSSAVEVWRGSRLRDLALTKGGVELEIDHPQRGAVTRKCELLVGADGLHSTVRRKAGLQSDKLRRYARWGTRCYFRSRERRNHVQVNLGPGLESYLTPLGDDLYGLAFLWSPHLLGRPLPGEGKVWERLAGLMGPELLDTIPAPEGEMWGDDRAIGPLQQRVLSPLHTSRRIALVGDAAGYLDALTGEGLCLGLRQARSLSQCILQGDLHHYPARHRAIKLRHQWMVSGLLWLVHHPRFRQRVFKALVEAPEQFSAVLRFAVEEANWNSLLSRHLTKFVTTLVRG